ncbi:MAG TPA: hypothetical protein VLM89_00765 [Phycisphaerae bacterium]|nr:hypothetical protein [Phycisphaerae bacterium]
MSHEAFTGEQIAGYNFDVPAPTEGFDPNSEGFRDMPPGTHEVELVFGDSGTGIVENQMFRVKDEGEVMLNQLRPKLRIVAGPHMGATTLDFLPMPTPGKHMPAKLANRWANFARAWGDDLAPGALVPHGFRLSPEWFAGKRCRVEVALQTDEHGSPKLKRDGRPMTGPRFFGYSRAIGSGPAASGPPAVPAQKPAPVLSGPPSDVEL